MRAYLSVFRIRLKKGLQYRIAAIAGIATQFFWGMMLIMIYQAFYSNTTAPQPISLEQVVTYMWLQQSLFMFIYLWLYDRDLFDLITTGNIAYEFCRPCNLYGFWYARLIAQRLAGAFLRCFPIIVVALLLPQEYRLMLPPDLITFTVFLLSIFLGLLLVVSISMLIYISVFLTMSPSGSMIIFAVIGDLLSGIMLPVPLMPDWLQKIVYVLPFRLTCDLPFRIYSGNILMNEALNGILIQCLWLVVLLPLGKILLDKVMAKVVIQGG